MMDPIRKALDFQDRRKLQYKAPERESARPLLPKEWPSYADLRVIASAMDALQQHEALLAAAQRVLDGLNARLDRATETGAPHPVFDGIADLHDAINRAKASNPR